jgi:hypothetical protein
MLAHGLSPGNVSRVTAPRARSEKILFDDVILLAARPMLPILVTQAFRHEVSSRRGVVCSNLDNLDTPLPPRFSQVLILKGDQVVCFLSNYKC